jgi:hypothetical protein
VEGKTSTAPVFVRWTNLHLKRHRVSGRRTRNRFRLDPVNHRVAFFGSSFVTNWFGLDVGDLDSENRFTGLNLLIEVVAYRVLSYKDL